VATAEVELVRAPGWLAEIVSAYRTWTDHWQGWRTRKGQIRALATGEFSKVFPRDFNDIDPIMVSNLFRDTIEDGGGLFAEFLPTERVPASGNRDEKRAEQIESVLSGFTQGSGIFNYPEYFGMDMIAAGVTAIKTWPRNTPDGRFPRHRRVDPDFLLPDPNYQPDQPTERAVIHYTDSVYRLQREYPEQIARLIQRLRAVRAAEMSYDLNKMLAAKGTPAELTVIEWYSSELIAKVAFYSDEIGRSEAELLTFRVNDTGLCPVQIAPRPTWSREPIGQLDDVKGIVRTQNRYMRLLIDYFAEMVYGGKLVWNVKNPTDRGPGTRYFALGPDAKMEPVTPEVPSFQAFQIMDRLEDAARSGANNPRSREGDVELNKATAAFLGKAQGKLNSAVRRMQRSFAVAKRYANEAALAQDEAWCDHRKTIVGLSRGKRFKLTYTPSALIRGDRANTVSYGTTSGMDQPTHNVLWLEKLQARGTSLETYLENDTAIDDVGQELARIAEGQMRDSVMMGLQLPDTPLGDRLLALTLFSEGKSVEEVAKALLARAQPAPAVPGLPGGTPAPGAARALGAPPGIPGAQGPPGPALPPPQLLRQLGRRR
jgi:hypothetical protein